MIKGVGILVLIIFLLSGVSATCNETQIDINAANSTELDKIVHVGNATAWKIINLRPFNSVDELVDVSGISVGYVLDIKQQGLACVNETRYFSEDNQNTTINDTNNEISSNILDNNTPTNNTSTKTTKPNNAYNPPKSTTETITLNAISLNSKDIKSEDNKEILKKNLALSGIITFCIGFGALFLLKSIKRREENEFR